MPQLTTSSDCTVTTCPIDTAAIFYVPTLIGNTLFLSIFSLLLLVQIFQLYLYRTCSFSICMILGLLLEIAGYIGRIQLHFDPWNGDAFLLYIICLTIAPVFFTAAIYLTLSRIIVHFSPSHTLSRFSPKTISITFITCDIIALVLQALGGGLANEASDIAGRDKGTWVMVAGLAFQVASLLAFLVVTGEFAWNVRYGQMLTRRLEKGTGAGGLVRIGEGFGSRISNQLKLFLGGMALATILILTRSVFRVAELSDGFTSNLANDEVTFMVLEGAMIVLATAVMTAGHPGRAFGVKWKNAGWRFGKQKRLRDVEEAGNDIPPLEFLK